MQILELVQGSPEWAAHRATHDNASDAPAMMGVSPYKTRTQLLDERVRGFAADVDASTQRLFDAGHRFEALARPLGEEFVGEELYPVTGTEGRLSASFDGLTLDGDTAWEHKSLNDDIRAVLPEDGSIGDANALPLYLRVQMEHQSMVSGASRTLFTASKWDGDKLIEARHGWYTPSGELRARIVAGWEQFHRDLATHTPAEAVPVVVAEPVQALPAVMVQVSGAIDIRDNFHAFETALRDFLEHRLIREPKTDQDFADLDLQIKAMKNAEAALDAAEAQMLAQIQTVDTAKKTKDMLAQLVRQNRLTSEKLLASEKE
ncbi:MAG: Ralstonia phage, partial [Pseudomonadota bacterium]